MIWAIFNQEEKQELTSLKEKGSLSLWGRLICEWIWDTISLTKLQKVRVSLQKEPRGRAAGKQMLVCSLIKQMTTWEEEEEG